MGNKRFGWHSGNLKVGSITVEDTMTVKGNLSFGDASTDTLTVTGLSTFTAQSEFDVANGTTTAAIVVDHNETDGAAIGMHIDVASTGTEAFAFKFTGIATNTGILQTDSVGTEANSVAAVLRVQGGSTTYYIPLMSTLA
jgi:hypothetical protein